MPGFKYGRWDSGICARLGCYADARVTITVGGTRYRVCRGHR